MYILKLVNPERYLRAPTTDRPQKNPVLPITANLNNFKQEIIKWHANTELVDCFYSSLIYKIIILIFFFQSLNSCLAHKIVKDLTPGGALMHGTTPQTLSRI